MKKDNKRFYTGKREDHDAPDSDRKEDIPALLVGAHSGLCGD
jgi:hypothetical protein